METYRDHPLAFLNSRPSVEGLSGRAETWRKRNHKVENLDVVKVLDRAAYALMMAKIRFQGLLDLVEEEASIDVVAQSCRYIDIDLGLANEAFEAGQHLRRINADPYGGSTSASLEMFADEFEHLAHCVETVIALADSTQSYDALETVIKDALDIRPPNDPEFETAHEAPRTLM